MQPVAQPVGHPVVSCNQGSTRVALCAERTTRSDGKRAPKRTGGGHQETPRRAEGEAGKGGREAAGNGAKTGRSTGPVSGSLSTACKREQR